MDILESRVVSLLLIALDVFPVTIIVCDEVASSVHIVGHIGVQDSKSIADCIGCVDQIVCDEVASATNIVRCICVCIVELGLYRACHSIYKVKFSTEYIINFSSELDVTYDVKSFLRISIGYAYIAPPGNRYRTLNT